MKKSILLAFVALIGVNCGNSAEQDLNEIIESIKKLAPCTGSKYQALGQTQIDEIKKIVPQRNSADSMPIISVSQKLPAV